MQKVPSSIQAKNTAARTHKQIPHPKKGLKRTHQETVATIRIESNTWFYFRLTNTVCWVGEVQNTKQTPHSRYSQQNPKELPAASIRGSLVIRRSPRTRVGPVFFFMYMIIRLGRVLTGLVHSHTFKWPTKIHAVKFVFEGQNNVILWRLPED